MCPCRNSIRHMVSHASSHVPGRVEQGVRHRPVERSEIGRSVAHVVSSEGRVVDELCNKRKRKRNWLCAVHHEHIVQEETAPPVPAFC